MNLSYPMNINREFTANRINAILNHAAVRPYVADLGAGTLDVSKQVANQGNVLLMGEHGGCLYFRIMEGIYEVHTAVAPEGRGQWTREFTQSTLHYMFTRTDAIEIMTRVPEGHKGAKLATEYVGMKYEFTRPDGCVFNSKVVPIDVYSFRLQDWVPMAEHLIDKGIWLHERMNAEAERLGIKEQPHSDDENHNRYVGACVEMINGGQYHKAVAFYNRWAFASRHACVKLVGIAPPSILFDVGVLVFKGNQVEIVR